MLRSIYYYVMGVGDTIASSIKIAVLGLLLEEVKWYEKVFGKIVKGWARRMVAYTGSKVELQGVEHINKEHAYVVLVNHQSNFDIYLILGYLHLQLCFISKQFYFKIPFIGGLMNKMGCIPIKRSSPKSAFKSMTLGAERLISGKSVIIYPEGSRSRDGKIKPFKKGFLHLIEAKVKSKSGNQECSVLPITLSGSKNIQTKGEYKVRPSDVRITIAPPIRVRADGINSSDKKEQLLTEIEDTIRSTYRERLFPK